MYDPLNVKLKKNSLWKKPPHQMNKHITFLVRLTAKHLSETTRCAPFV